MDKWIEWLYEAEKATCKHDHIKYFDFDYEDSGVRFIRCQHCLGTLNEEYKE